MTEAVIRLYRFLVEMDRLSTEEYEQIVGKPYGD